jgi:hypothetical protein
MSGTSYRDELAFVNYLIGRLEIVLAGREDDELLRIMPTDRCQLGVLAPREAGIDIPEDADSAEDELGESDTGDPTEVITAVSPSAGSSDESDDVVEDQGVQLSSMQISDRAWKPASSMGSEFVLSGDGSRELLVDVSFAIYLPSHASWREQRTEIGAGGDDSPEAGHTDRQRVTLLQKFRRHTITVQGVRLAFDPGRVSVLRDDGLIQAEIVRILDAHRSHPMSWREGLPTRVVPVRCLRTEHEYDAFIASLPVEREAVPIRASLQARCEPFGDAGRISVYLRNDTATDDLVRSHNHYRILGDASLTIRLVRGRLEPIELMPVPQDYQYDREVFAIGRNVSVKIDRNENTIYTRSLARFDQPRRTTNERFSATYLTLAEDPLAVLESLRRLMVEYESDWRERIIEWNELHFTPEALVACGEDLKNFGQEIKGFAEGIAALAASSDLQTAFKAMNRAFVHSGHEKWHLFQIVFIVTQLTALAAREGITAGEWPVGEVRNWEDALDTGDVLWFPTGGGKTEAYLALVSCAALFDRLRGKDRGVTAWLRFPLRMLSIQQLQRAARVLWATELQRLALQDELGRDLGDRFALGYFVGGSNTPNQFGWEWSFEKLESDAKLRDKLLLLKDCPACSAVDGVDIVLDPVLQRAKHVCRECGVDLPIYVSDVEIYRFLPTLIVGTVDKLASIAYQPKLARLWTAPEWRCPIPGHGYGSGTYCIIYDCLTNPGRATRGVKRPRRIQLEQTKDAAPSLHIQDELHLLQEELGAFAGHYETLLLASEMAVSNARAKIIAATATIEGYVHQVRHLYGSRYVRRFPNRGYDLAETFYTSPDLVPGPAKLETKTMRVFTAFRPPYLSDDAAASLCAETLHRTINALRSDPVEARRCIGIRDASSDLELNALFDLYSRTLTYVGNRDKGVRIQKRLERAGSVTDGLAPNGARDLNVEYISSHSTLKDIAVVIGRLESSADWTSSEFLDATVATDVISHGVDVEVLNLMVMQRIPEDAAAYIQASSRCGRRHVGLVIAVLPRHSLRATSIYDRFPEYHEHLDRIVSPVPINRFARHAVARTFPGVLLGMIYGRYPAVMNQRSGAAQLAVVQAAFQPPGSRPRPLDRDQLWAELEESYALDSPVYPTGMALLMRKVLHDAFEFYARIVVQTHHQSLQKVSRPAPMASLRDVDSAVRFQPDPDHVTELQLRLFRGDLD